MALFDDENLPKVIAIGAGLGVLALLFLRPSANAATAGSTDTYGMSGGGTIYLPATETTYDFGSGNVYAPGGTVTVPPAQGGTPAPSTLPTSAPPPPASTTTPASSPTPTPSTAPVASPTIPVSTPPAPASSQTPAPSTAPTTAPTQSQQSLLQAWFGAGAGSSVVSTPASSASQNKTVTVKTPSGQIIQGSDYKAVVNQAGGLWQNGQWVSGYYNAQGQFVRTK